LHPVLFQVHGIVVGTYGIALILGLLAALGWLRRQPAVPARIKARFELFLLVAASGAFAATLAEGLVLHLAGPEAEAGVPWPLLIRRGGSIQVALLGGALALVLYLRYPWRALAAVGDLLAPAAALFQAIARLGCLMAGCCFGRPSEAFLSVTFTDPLAQRWAGTPLGIPLVPTQLYYSLANGVIFLVLRRLLARKRRDGTVLSAWLILEGLQRVLLDTWRWDPGPSPLPGLPWLTENRWISLAFIGLGLALALSRNRSRPVALS
jgi:phosphatidylglycerol:prolipoprotein diacylglycerol transferase